MAPAWTRAVALRILAPSQRVTVINIALNVWPFRAGPRVWQSANLTSSWLSLKTKGLVLHRSFFPLVAFAGQ